MSGEPKKQRLCDDADTSALPSAQGDMQNMDIDPPRAAVNEASAAADGDEEEDMDLNEEDEDDYSDEDDDDDNEDEEEDDDGSEQQQQQSSVQPAVDSRFAPRSHQSQQKVVQILDRAGETHQILLSDYKSFRRMLQVYGAIAIMNDQGEWAEDYQYVWQHEVYTLVINDYRPGIGPLASIKQSRREPRDIYYGKLPELSEIQAMIPSRRNKLEQFLCPENYFEPILDDIGHWLDADDATHGACVPPMAFVGCAGSGKTAILDEIATRLSPFLAGKGAHPTAIMYLTFTDYSSAKTNELSDPLQALFRRMVFTTTSSLHGQESCVCQDAFYKFCGQGNTFRMTDMEDWLGDKRVVLLVDEITNLDRATSKDALPFGAFLCSYFLSKRDRYLVFTSRSIGEVEDFGRLLDEASMSSRRINIQNLVQLQNLRPIYMSRQIHFESRSIGIYCHMMPSLIIEHCSHRRRAEVPCGALAVFNSMPEERREQGFKMVLASLFSGLIEDVPKELRSLLVARKPTEAEGEAVLAKVIWVPRCLKYFFERAELKQDGWLNHAKYQMSKMSLYFSADDSYEAMFTICYASRCIARRPFKDWLPDEWTRDADVRVVFNPFKPQKARMFYHHCICWSQIRNGIDVGLEPTIALFCPRHAWFPSYDVIAAYFIKGEMLDCRAFQLKENDCINLNAPPKGDEISNRFLIMGAPPRKTFTCKHTGWNVPDAKEIDEFYGESGKNWTPQQWHMTRSF